MFAFIGKRQNVHCSIDPLSSGKKKKSWDLCCWPETFFFLAFCKCSTWKHVNAHWKQWLQFPATILHRTFWIYDALHHQHLFYPLYIRIEYVNHLIANLATDWNICSTPMNANQTKFTILMIRMMWQLHVNLIQFVC